MPRPDTNYLTAAELEFAAKLIEVLNSLPRTSLSADVQLVDSNGEPAGVIAFSESGSYALYPGGSLT